MASKPTSPDEILQRLDRRTFRLDEIAKVIGAHPSTLLNYINKNGLELCSSKPGRGRERRYCLIDVYALQIMTVLVNLTGNAKAAAQRVNQVVFWAEGEYEEIINDKIKDILCDSIESAPYVLFYRRRLNSYDLESGDYFLIIDKLESFESPVYRYISSEAPIDADYRDNEFSTPLRNGSLHRPIGIWINVTHLLSRIDELLLKIVEGEWVVE